MPMCCCSHICFCIHGYHTTIDFYLWDPLNIHLYIITSKHTDFLTVTRLKLHWTVCFFINNGSNDFAYVGKVADSVEPPPAKHIV